ncbi:MAG: hypothetical protein DWQ09_01485 [Proteobacteria bacterium]|nr:MAG: hypothetical protein DWQ09_01485 [Pseudomonadota bacterium]
MSDIKTCNQSYIINNAYTQFKTGYFFEADDRIEPRARFIVPIHCILSFYSVFAMVRIINKKEVLAVFTAA